MDDDPDRRHIGRLIETASDAAGADAQVRAVAARQRASDRCDPVASRWLARWSPKPVLLPVPRCSCASGRCAVCN